jgi:hypothetical protein
VLVDEFEDFSRLADRSGGVEIVTADARVAQEDASRARMEPDATLMYRLGGPVASVKVYAFAEDASASLAVGIGRETAEPRRGAVRGLGGGDYGYLVPLEFEVTSNDPAADTVTLTAGASRMQVSRIEIRHGGQGHR